MTVTLLFVCTPPPPLPQASIAARLSPSFSTYLTYLSFFPPRLAFFGSVIASLARSTVCQRNIIHFSLYWLSHTCSLAHFNLTLTTLEPTVPSSPPPLLLFIPCMKDINTFAASSSSSPSSVSGALRGVGRRINIPSMVATSSSVLTLLPFPPFSLFFPPGNASRERENSVAAAAT